MGAQWNPVALDEEVRARLTGLGWYLSGGRWCHVIFPSGFSLSEIVEDKLWAKAAHFLRESWRKQSFERLVASGRHEFQGELIPEYSSDRIRLAKSWADFDGLSLKLSLGGLQSPYVRALGHNGCEVQWYKCGLSKVNWEHLWTCGLGMDPPHDLFLRRFLWPRSSSDIQLCFRFPEVAQHFASLYNA